jgi:hypothetical protein
MRRALSVEVSLQPQHLKSLPLEFNLLALHFQALPLSHVFQRRSALVLWRARIGRRVDL